MKEGISGDVAAGLLAEALGVSCGEVGLGGDMGGLVRDGGGMALRSISSQDSAASLGFSFVALSPVESGAMCLVTGWKYRLQRSGHVVGVWW